LTRLERRQKKQGLNTKQKEQLESKIHVARVNLNYTIYYPLTEKYISLYPKSKSSGKDDAESESESEAEEKVQSDKTKPPLWSVVEKCMEDDTLGELRDGKLNIGADGQPTATLSVKTVADTYNRKGKKKEKKESKKPQDAIKSQPKRDKGKYDKATRKARRQGLAKTAPVPVQADGNESDGGFFE